MTEKQKNWIDNSSYETLLSHWRFAPVGDEMFQGETGDYYKQVMFEKRKNCDNVAVSKHIGW